MKRKLTAWMFEVKVGKRVGGIGDPSVYGNLAPHELL